jgi:hypothetical protein
LRCGAPQNNKKNTPNLSWPKQLQKNKKKVRTVTQSEPFLYWILL